MATRPDMPPRFDVALAVVLAVLALAELFLGSATDGARAVQVTATLAMTLPVAWRRTAPAAAAVVIISATIASVIAGVPVTEGFVPLLALMLVVYGVARADVLEDELEEHTTRATIEERARIARELHDVVAHRLSTIAVQAGAGLHVLHEDPDRAREAFDAIDETARSGLSEMRQALGLLRSDDGDAVLAPQPSLRRIEDLAAESRTAGIPVDLTVTGDAGTVPAGVDLSAYRIVQEALTNVRRHAPGANASVDVDIDAHRVLLRVSDEGGTPSPAAATTAGDGHGLVGIRERVALYGGQFAAAPGADGGFVLTATLPYNGQPR